MNDFELERQRRIEANRLRMLEMGIGAMASKIQAPAPVPAPKVRNPRASSPEMRFFPPDCVPEPSGVSLTRSIRAPPRAAPRHPRFGRGVARAVYLLVSQPPDPRCARVSQSVSQSPPSGSG